MDSLPTASTLVMRTMPRWDPRKGPTRRRGPRRCHRTTSRTLHRTRPPEPTVAPESGGRPLRKKGKTVTPAASVQPEVPDNLLEALNGASIEEEHRTVMSAVIQKVQLAKSGLTEACSSLLTGFEVRISIYVKWYRIDSSP